MMAKNPMYPLLRRSLASLLAVLIGLGPLATPGYAAITQLADEPLNVKNQAKPNVVLTVDDSTSMLYDFLPDYVVSSDTSAGAVAHGTGLRNAPCGFSGSPFGKQPGDPFGYFSPQYIWEQTNLPYRAYSDRLRRQRPRCRLPDRFASPPPICSPGIAPGALPGLATYPAGHAKGSAVRILAALARPRAQRRVEPPLLQPAANLPTRGQVGRNQLRSDGRGAHHQLDEGAVRSISAVEPECRPDDARHRWAVVQFRLDARQRRQRQSVCRRQHWQCGAQSGVLSQQWLRQPCAGTAGNGRLHVSLGAGRYHAERLHDQGRHVDDQPCAGRTALPTE